MPDHAARLAAHVAALNVSENAIVGGYVALPGEADPSALMELLHGQGCGLALPRVAGKDAALAFHRWEPGLPLVAGAFGVSEPEPAMPRIVPDVLLVPLLAFDTAGHRLGYGGGFYDRTLAGLRALGPIRTIGVAYAGQEVENLPHEEFDERLDMMLTEAGLRRFKPEP